jgi:hypothetical protein
MLATDHRRQAAISNEIDAVTSLVRHGLRALEEYRFAAHDAERVFALLAGGAEKLLKLSIGFHGRATRGRWESTRRRKHEIVRLDERTREIIREGVSSGDVVPHVGRLLDAVDQDANIDQILRTLQRYAMSGRYYNLDDLGDTPQPEDSPAQMWEELHQELFVAHPSLSHEDSPEGWEAERRALNEAIAGSLRRWYEMIEQAWRCGAFGTDAARWAGQLRLSLVPLG